MNRYIHHKTQWFLGATLYAYSSQIVRFLSLMRKSVDGDIQHRLWTFAAELLTTVFLLMLVKNRAWRYGFICVLVAESLLFAATMLSTRTMSGAVAVGFLSFIPLIPALPFFLQFRRAENVEVYGGEYESKWTVWYLLGIGLLMIALIFYFGSL
jgi:hypothetical protein